MRRGFLRFQIGKNGINSGLIESLSISFKKNKSVRINALKSSERDRKKIKEMAEEIINKLDGNYTFKIIGFTIIVRRVGLKKKR